MPYAIDFGAAPREGDTLRWSDQDYRVAKSTSFTTAGGDRIVSIEWETHCPDCGATLRFTTGAKKPWLAKRCKRCNAGDKDKLERRYYAKKLWSERLLAGKRAKAVAEGRAKPDALAAKVEAAVLIRSGTVMRCALVWPGGKRVEFDYAPGMEIDEDEATPALMATIPYLSAEFKRLTEFRALMGDE